MRHVVARLARHDNICARGDGELSKVAQGAAQNGDRAAWVIGLAPHARVAAKRRGGTVGEVAWVGPVGVDGVPLMGPSIELSPGERNVGRIHRLWICSHS